MRKNGLCLRKTLFPICLAAMLAAISCAVSSENSNSVATLYRNTPTPAPNVNANVEPTPTASAAPSESPSPIVTPMIAPTPSASIPPPGDEPAANPNKSEIVVTSPGTLTIPVAGIKRAQLTDTFTAARSGGRVHDAIDIMAAGGTPIIAATGGKIIRFFDSERGGITIYQLSPDERTVYYYAHLQRRADNLSVGDTVQQGALLGYVGDTGNSGAGNYHLHFAIWTISDPKHFWDGTNINPYPLLKQGKEE